MPDNDYNTALFSLYFLRVMDNPTIIVNDIQELDTREQKARDLSRKKIETVNRIKQLIGLAAVSGLTALVSFLARLGG